MIGILFRMMGWQEAVCWWIWPKYGVLMAGGEKGKYAGVCPWWKLAGDTK